MKWLIIILLLILIGSLIYFSPIHFANLQIDNYHIPLNYRGWLIIRQLPNNQKRPVEMDFIFDKDGFCTTHFDIAGFIHENPYYCDNNGNIIKKLEQGNRSIKADDDEIYFWDYGTEGPATSLKYKGEYWFLYYVGTKQEFEKDTHNKLEFLSTWGVHELRHPIK